MYTPFHGVFYTVYQKAPALVGGEDVTYHQTAWDSTSMYDMLKEYFNEVKLVRGANRAKVSTAKRFLSIIYHILREKRYYVLGRLA